MENSTNIVCVMKSGGLYTPDWVYKLYRGVIENTTNSHRFICLSDKEIPGIETIPLKHKWPGWWSNIELFRPGILSGTNIYIDLDSIITGDVSAISILHEAEDFVMLKDWGKTSKKIGYQSSVMMWSGDWSLIYKKFRKNPEYYMKNLKGGKGGDQVFIPIALESAGKFPKTLSELSPKKLVASYKNDRCHHSYPADSVIVTFHGKSKHEKMEKGWAGEKWNLEGWEIPVISSREEPVVVASSENKSKGLISNFLKKVRKFFLAIDRS